MKKIRFYILLLLFLSLALMLAALGAVNQTTVTVNLFFLAPQLRLSTLMAVLLFLGFLFGVLASLYLLAKIRLRQALKLRKSSQSKALTPAEKKPETVLTTVPATVPATTTAPE